MNCTILALREQERRFSYLSPSTLSSSWKSYRHSSARQEGGLMSEGCSSTRLTVMSAK